MPSTPQLPLDLRVVRAAQFENYRAASSDATASLIRAHAGGYAAAGVGDHIECVVYLWGTEGSGKTHLLEAAINHALGAGRQAVLMQGADLNDSLPVTDLDLLCVDDLDAMAGDSEAERSLFRSFEDMRAAGKQLLVAAKRPPAELAIALEDLRSRLMWGPVLRIDPLDDDDLRLHFQAHAEQFGLSLRPDVVDYVLRHCPRDAGYLEALAMALHRQSLAERRHVTVRMVSQFLADQQSRDGA